VSSHSSPRTGAYRASPPGLTGLAYSRTVGVLSYRLALHGIECDAPRPARSPSGVPLRESVSPYPPRAPATVSSFKRDVFQPPARCALRRAAADSLAGYPTAKVSPVWCELVLILSPFMRFLFIARRFPHSVACVVGIEIWHGLSHSFGSLFPRIGYHFRSWLLV
jgi:hypothetical protein